MTRYIKTTCVVFLSSPVNVVHPTGAFWRENVSEREMGGETEIDRERKREREQKEREERERETTACSHLMCLPLRLDDAPTHV